MFPRILTEDASSNKLSGSNLRQRTSNLTGFMFFVMVPSKSLGHFVPGLSKSLRRKKSANCVTVEGRKYLFKLSEKKRSQ
jgi:hypothetical protein